MIGKCVKVCGQVLAVGAASVFVMPDVASAKSKKAPSPAALFDASKRKKTRHALSPSLSYSAYGNVRYLGERDIRRDDAQRDTSDEVSLSLGFVARAQLGNAVRAFLHLEASLKDKRTHSRSYGRIMDPRVKEALVAVSLSPTTTVSVGRLRFSDAHKWVADASVDGVHLSVKSSDRVLEFAAVQGTEDITSSYLMAHAGFVAGKTRWGGLALAEQEGDAERLYLAGYYAARSNPKLSYQLNGAVVAGDAANGQSAGIGFDLRATRKLTDTKLKPQVTFGFAYGSKGFRQSGLHSNKTRDGGQTQFHRCGTVFQPELTNLAVATIGLGIRPSRKLSADVIASFYAQPSASTTGPDARLRGRTNGTSRFVGTDLSIVGAYRVSKKTKFELGAGRFFPGAAYLDQSPATRVFTRFSVYF